MSILSRANKEFEQKRYSQALTLYEQAAKILGMQFVKANIFLCKRALADQGAQSPTSLY